MRGYEYETNGYHRAMEDEYEGEYYDQDEYEEEGSGAGEEYVEEEEEPPEGQQEFLKIRERLKEQIRRRAQGAGASTAGRSSSSHDRKPPTNFGSFFGPSKPVISQRVIEERKSMKELQNTMSRDRRPSGKDIPSSSNVQAKTNGLHQKQKIVNEAKRKAEALKDNRDYSFLLSDDADISSSPKEKPASRSSFTQKSDRELTHSAVKSRAPASQPAKLSNGYGLKNTSSTLRHTESKVDSKRKEAFPNRERDVSLDNGRMRSVVRNGSNQASTSKVASQKFPSKGPIANKPSMKDLNDQSLRKNNVASKHLLSQNEQPQSSQSQRMQPASHGQRSHQSAQSQRPQQSLQSRKPQQSSQSQRPQQSSQSRTPRQSSQSQRPQQPSQSQRPQQPSQSQRPQQPSQSQRPQQPSQSQRPQQPSQSQRPQQPSQSQRPQQSSQSQRPQQSSQSQRPQQSSQIERLQSSQSQRSQSESYRWQSSQGHYSEQKRVQANDRVKPVRPPSKPMPSRQTASNGIRDVHAKKKQPTKRRFDDEVEDEEDALAMIRSMFRYDPSKYAGRDEDDSDMEADFATIEREEKRSARIARQEDEEQLRLIEEEERREQERKRRRVAHGR